jgi:hypothetical protein
MKMLEIVILQALTATLMNWKHEQNKFTKCPILNAKQFQKISTISKNNLRTFKLFFINSRTFKALNFCFQIQGPSRIFKFCTNPAFRSKQCIKLTLEISILYTTLLQL